MTPNERLKKMSQLESWCRCLRTNKRQTIIGEIELCRLERAAIERRIARITQDLVQNEVNV
jgi:hypothetical protein